MEKGVLTMEHEHFFKTPLFIQENHATVKLDSSVAPRGIKTYSESKIELQNLQFLKKMLKNRH